MAYALKPIAIEEMEMSSVVDRMRLRAHAEQQVLEEVEEVEEVRTSMSCAPVCTLGGRLASQPLVPRTSE